MKVLSFNAGSSTLKFALFDLDRERATLTGVVDRLGTEAAILIQRFEEGREDRRDHGAITLTDAVGIVLGEVPEFEAVGCRVVHGGPRFNSAVKVDQRVIEDIRSLAPFAPLHNARDVEVIEAVNRTRPDVPVVAVFDTTFHTTLPEIARHYALPHSLAADKNVRRFGFHGISYRFVADRMKEARGADKGRMVLCHLGNGASVCAVLDGKSVETSMGMTPLEGLIMGTRCGDVDPGAVLYLLREHGMSVPEVDRALNNDAGLLGLSGISSDLRELERAVGDGNSDADFALDAFAYRIAKYVGAYSVVLGGLDALVFSGGIGENSTDVRARVCRRLTSLGIAEPGIKDAGPSATCLSGSQIPSVWVVRTNEEHQIAIETREVLSAAA